MIFEGAILSGVLTAIPPEALQQPEFWEFRDDIVYPGYPLPDWKMFTIDSGQPLIGESTASSDTYRYPFLLRRSADHWLITSLKKTLVRYLLKASGLEKRVCPPQVNIPALVLDAIERPHDTYVLSTIWGRIEGYGTSLETVTLYGQDLADAELFRSFSSHLTPTRAELRNVRRGRSVLSINNIGEISFYYGGPRTLKDVIDALKYLTDSRYISWGSDDVNEIEPGKL